VSVGRRGVARRAQTKGLKLIKFCKKISDYDELDVMVRRVPAANYNEDAFAVLWRRAPTLEAEPEDEDVVETVTARTVQTLTVRLSLSLSLPLSPSLSFSLSLPPPRVPPNP
jgi:hypothetical protein